MAGTIRAAPIRSSVHRMTRVLCLVHTFAIVAIRSLVTAFFLESSNTREAAPFLRSAHRGTRMLMQPFRGILSAVEGLGGSVIDASLLFVKSAYGMSATGMHASRDWSDRKIPAARDARIEAYQARWETAIPRDASLCEAWSAPAEPSAERTPSGTTGGRSAR